MVFTIESEFSGGAKIRIEPGIKLEKLEFNCNRWKVSKTKWNLKQVLLEAFGASYGENPGFFYCDYQRITGMNAKPLE